MTTKCLVLSTKRLVAAAKFLVAATKNLFVVPNFVAVSKPFFFRVCQRLIHGAMRWSLFLLSTSQFAPPLCVKESRLKPY